jgi:hypothetical protein
MTMPPPASPKIYHIVHVDRLPSIIADGVLWCDAEIVRRAPPGTTIGMNKIKQRRLTELHLSSHPGLLVGGCVTFYFCQRSIMLYLIHMANDPELTYRGGQGPIVHLEADLNHAVAWADLNERRWLSPCRTPAPTISRIAATWRSWTRSTGPRSGPTAGAGTASRGR